MKIGIKLVFLSLIFAMTLTIAIQIQFNNPNLVWIFSQDKMPQSNSRSNDIFETYDISFGGEKRANNNVTDDQTKPSVCCFPDGSFVISWAHYVSTNNRDVYARIFDSSGTPTSGDIQVNSYTANHQENPSIGCFSNGSFVVVWESEVQDGQNDGVFAKVFNSTGHNQTDDIQVNTWTDENQQKPSVSCINDSYFIASWQSYGQSGSWEEVWARVFHSNGTPFIGEFHVNSNTTNYQQTPSVSCRANGDFVIAWESDHQSSTNYEIYFKIFNITGNNQTDEIQANVYTTLSQRESDVCYAPDGSIIVAWDGDSATDNAGVNIRLFDSTGNPKTGDIRVNSWDNSQTQGNPSICCFSDGSFVIVWMSDLQDGDQYGVYAKTFESSGDSETDDVQVNSYTTLDQSYPSVCCYSNKLVVIWDSNGQDTPTSRGIYFKIGEKTKEIDLILLSKLLEAMGSGDNTVLIIVGIIAGIAAAVIIGILFYRYRHR